VWDLLQTAYEMFGNRQVTIAITGSGGIALAEYLHITFVQEVIAGTKAVRAFYPQADVIIELGGEDAKITYLTGGNEHRMNGNCAAAQAHHRPDGNAVAHRCRRSECPS
jgi:activator of 2-hydroxyglutaryl-CoA dehydratase